MFDEFYSTPCAKIVCSPTIYLNNDDNIFFIICIFASLESVLETENSGFLVPLLLRRAILEIEKRGLDIIGNCILEIQKRGLDIIGNCILEIE